jgi:hypothetical protein
MKGQIVYSLDQGKHDAIEESFAKMVRRAAEKRRGFPRSLFRRTRRELPQLQPWLPEQQQQVLWRQQQTQH